MTIVHHPDPATLMSFAAGTLSEALSAVIATHAEMCPFCRREMRRLEMLGGMLMGHVAPVSAEPPSVSAAMLAAPSRPEPVRDGLLPPTVARLVGGGLDRVGWSVVSPGVHVARLPLSPGSDGLLVLIRIGGGKAIPEHGHGGAELTLVLDGSFTDKAGRFTRGDISDLDEEAEHQPVADMGADCICLFASETKLRFKGVLPRLLQPIIGI